MNPTAPACVRCVPGAYPAQARAAFRRLSRADHALHGRRADSGWAEAWTTSAPIQKPALHSQQPASPPGLVLRQDLSIFVVDFLVGNQCFEERREGGGEHGRLFRVRLDEDDWRFAPWLPVVERDPGVPIAIEQHEPGWQVPLLRSCTACVRRCAIPRA